MPDDKPTEVKVTKKQPKQPPRDKQAKVAKVEAPPEPQPPPAPQMKAGTRELPKGITQRTWKGLPLYQCDKCPFNDLQIARVIEHVAAVHAPQYVDTGLVGPSGGTIVKEV